MDGGFVDCHCHISAAEFTEDIEDVIKHTKEAGVMMLISVTEEVTEFEKVIQLSKIYPGLVAPCLGVHPVQRTESEDHRSVTMQDLEPALPLFQKYKDDIVAIGEVGLDFTPWYAPYPQQRAEQQAVFVKQLEIARQMNLPVNVHSRSAARVTIATLKEQGVRHALLHNFAGKLSVALEGVQAGYYFSFPPAICRSEQVRNEPSNITLSCDYIARVKGLAPEKVMEATAVNAARLFPTIGKFMSQAGGLGP